jgi:arabinogalactan endo-1,4-beta-galactosidase
MIKVPIRTLLLIFFYSLWNGFPASTVYAQQSKGHSALKQAIRGADISFLPEVRESGNVFYNQQGQVEDMLVTMQRAGMNTARLRIWNAPSDKHSSVDEVASLADELHHKGINVWLTMHYSDWWADPGKQNPPKRWENLEVAVLADSVYHFTKHVVQRIKPDIIQIGNEINNGILWPQGHINQKTQLIQLLDAGVKAVRDASPATKIMMHYAGYAGASSFYSSLGQLDYDLIGISYYPFWHGKSLDSLRLALGELHTTFRKDVIVAEVAYPFTFDYDDAVGNVIGLPEQIHPDYPPTPQGQWDFLKALKYLCWNTNGVTGYCYWAPEWVSLYGKDSQRGSAWENQALWDYEGRALPSLQWFSPDTP